MLVLKLAEELWMWNLHSRCVRGVCGGPSCELEAALGNGGWVGQARLKVYRRGQGEGLERIFQRCSRTRLEENGLDEERRGC